MERFINNFFLVLLAFIVIIGVPFLIKLSLTQNGFISVPWNEIDILIYYGSVLTFIGTCSLGVLALMQNRQIQENNEKFEMKMKENELKLIKKENNRKVEVWQIISINELIHQKKAITKSYIGTSIIARLDQAKALSDTHQISSLQAYQRNPDLYSGMRLVMELVREDVFFDYISAKTVLQDDFNMFYEYCNDIKKVDNLHKILEHDKLDKDSKELKGIILSQTITRLNDNVSIIDELIEKIKAFNI